MKLRELIKTIYSLVIVLRSVNLFELNVVYMLDDYAIPIDRVDVNITERRIELHEQKRRAL